MEGEVPEVSGYLGVLLGLCAPGVARWISL